MIQLRCVIVDDDKVFQTILEGYVGKTELLELIGVFDNAIEASNFLSKNKADILFLDIEMPEMTGLELIQTFKEKPQVILVSASKEYALEAFEYSVTDYLLKPLDSYGRFLSAVQKARDNLTTSQTISQDEFLFVKEDSKFIKLEINEILYLQAYGDYTKIFVNDEVHVILKTFKSLSDKLPTDTFFQCHRSYLVNLKKIKSLEGNSLWVGPHFIPVSRASKDNLLKKIMPL